MVLNYIWIAFFLLAFVVGLVKLIFFGDTSVFPAMMGSTFDMAKTGFEISIGLTGVLTLWLGLMKIGEAGGMVKILSRLFGPLFRRLFPELPADCPAQGSIIMNLASNMLGLGNAATPIGLKAMKEMQEVNPNKDTASNPMIMFLVLNTSGLTLIPMTIMVYRAQFGAADPSDILLPSVIATFIAMLAGLVSVAIMQKINLFNRVVLAYLGTLFLVITALIWFFSRLPQADVTRISSIGSNLILFSVIISFFALGIRKKLNLYETFIEGAKEGFEIAIKIIPYLIAIMVAIGVFRASGSMDFIISGFDKAFIALGLDTSFVPALPTALMKPLSGSGTRGLMVEAMQSYGVDSLVGRMVCVIQGSADTTFYILAVYFGTVGIRKTRYALTCGLITDVAGIVAAIILSYIFFA